MTIFRGIAALLVVLHLLVFERAILNGTRASHPALSILVAVAGAVIYLSAIAVLLGVWRPRRRAVVAFLAVVAVASAVRFHLPREILRRHSAGLMDEFAPLRIPNRLGSEQAPELVSFLRQTAAAQEQYRLRAGSYSKSIDSLRDWAVKPAGSVVSIVAHDDQGWSARVSLDGRNCSIWVRDSSLRPEPAQTEGHPTCGPEHRMPYEAIPSVVVSDPPAETRFVDADIRGTWLQHRADERRTGAVMGDDRSAGYRWDAQIAGPLRSSVSIAGNQVFVGAHGNGELVGLTLDSGKLGFRIRAPNWVHHEPAISDHLVVVGFGNNERLHGRQASGTAPSGVVAYDRRTGVEQWRRYTDFSVMGAPVISDSTVAVSTGGREAVGMRLRDGAELWRTPVVGHSPMGNPLLIDTALIYGAERTAVCSIAVRTGRIVYCRALDNCCWGAGHASPAISGDLVLQVISEPTSFEFDPAPRRNISYYARRIFGIPSTSGSLTSRAVVVALQWRDGRERWRTPLGRGRIIPRGHVAGTPTVVDSIAYVPSVFDGNVAAIHAQSGRLLWSTPVRVTRGSVAVTRGSVIAATLDTSFVVLDAASGRVSCRQRLPAGSDRAGLTISGETGVLALRNGVVMARPLSEWLACQVLPFRRQVARAVPSK